ncbi:MAG: 3-deoxy-manno-octulosonate cytidylyltransferase [candidate division KSB1 bacterium]|nr:3-deoxy-manno-octulosonate cytidylyltransferase [candidate division KSB1 bacterium]
MGRAQVLGVIPARWASRRFPGKPLADIAGKPMIQWVWEAARRAQTLDRLLVATDDERIYTAVQGFGGEALLTPDTFASGSDRVAWVATRMPEFAIVANIQGDEPLLNPAVLDAAVETLLQDPAAEVVTLARPVEDPSELDNVNTARVVVDHQGYALYFSRAVIPYCRDVPDVHQWPQHHLYLDQIGLYVYRREALLRFSALPPSSLEQVEKLEQLRLLQNGIRVKVRIVEGKALCVDTPEDLEMVRRLVAAGGAARRV